MRRVRLPTNLFRKFSNKGWTDFGFKDVNINDKEKFVKEVFSSVASKYDVMNDLMSLGVHRVWKDDFVQMIGLAAAAKADPNYIPKHLDVAGGTGDIAFRTANIMSKCFHSTLSQKLQTDEYNSTLNRPIIVCDINPDMLAVGKTRTTAHVGQEKSKLVKR
jgi:2-methoxy-6-polyprenyl-1,4-benzoquinol methylase